jgi:hypothetical protein
MNNCASRQFVDRHLLHEFHECAYKTQGPDPSRAADGHHERAPTLFAKRVSQRLRTRLEHIPIVAAGEMQSRTEHEVGDQAARGCARAVSPENEVAIKTVHGGRRGDRPSVVGLGCSHGDKGVGVDARRFAEQEFELSHFVSTGGDAIEVIALQPNVGSNCFREAERAVERGRSQAE